MPKTVLKGTQFGRNVWLSAGPNIKQIARQPAAINEVRGYVARGLASLNPTS